MPLEHSPVGCACHSNLSFGKKIQLEKKKSKAGYSNRTSMRHITQSSLYGDSITFFVLSNKLKDVRLDEA